MPSLDLHYYRLHVGQALIDPALADLSMLKWNVKIPTQVLIEHKHRPDIICARLRDPDDLIHRCHPVTFVSIKRRSFHVYLARLAIQPELVTPLLRYALTRDPIYFNDLRDVAVIVQRIVFINGSRVDCRSTNLREITTGVNPQESVFHEA